MKLVSAVMPTRGRRTLAAKALDSFLSQTYSEKELVILDDADDPSFPDGVQHELVRYHVVTERLNIPQKRNRVNALATGPLIAHFDSDDWSYPDRIAEQVEYLESTGKAMTGYYTCAFINSQGVLSRYVGPTCYAVGTSHCYYKWFWELNKFPEHKRGGTGTDNDLVRAAAKARQLHTVDGGMKIIARIHDDNTSRKPDKYKWECTEPLPAGFVA